MFCSFSAEVDTTAAISYLENTVTVSGTSVDSNGMPINDSNGIVLMASDNSDSGVDPGTNNPDEPGDTGGSDDPTPLYIPLIGLAKEAGDAVANGDNWDVTFTLVFENTGTVDLENLMLLDDITDEFGNAFVSINGLSVDNFMGSGSAPTANLGWLTDTTQSLISGSVANIGDSFEVIFTVTIDPDGVDSVSQALQNQAIGVGDALDENGMPLTASMGDRIQAMDLSDNGVEPISENDEDNNDGIFGNDPTPVFIADLGIAKTLVGEPILSNNGIFTATYQLVVENIGTVDLRDLSFLEDLSNQFGSAVVDAGGLTLTVAPTNAASDISINSGGWDGTTVVELMDTSAANLLKIGDSFTIEFTVDIDPLEVVGVLENQVEGLGNAIDDQGNLIFTNQGSILMAFDLSDSGTETSGTNPGAPGDEGTSDDPTLYTPAPLPLGSISVAVFVDENNNGIQENFERGISGVEIVLRGIDVYGNSVELNAVTSGAGRYTFSDLVAGIYRISEIQPDGYLDGRDSGRPQWVIGNDEISNIVLDWGQTLSTATFGERLESLTNNDFLPNTPRPPSAGPLPPSSLSVPAPNFRPVFPLENGAPLSIQNRSGNAGGYWLEMMCHCPELENVELECTTTEDCCGDPSEQIQSEDSFVPDVEPVVRAIENVHVPRSEGMKTKENVVGTKEDAIPIEPENSDVEPAVSELSSQTNIHHDGPDQSNSQFKALKNKFSFFSWMKFLWG